MNKKRTAVESTDFTAVFYLAKLKEIALKSDKSEKILFSKIWLSIM
jgi:hypothetical protein